MIKRALIKYGCIFLIIFFILILIGFKDKKEDKKTFTFWTIQLKAPAGDIIQKNINIFKNRYPELKIVWVDIPIGEAQKRTIASILGGNPPDLINLNPEFSLLLAQKNALEYFNEYEVKNYNEGIINKLKYENKIYALPFYATSSVTVLNKEKFKNCNVKLETYNDILKLSSCNPLPVFGISLNEGGSFAKILNKYNVNQNSMTPDSIKEVYYLFYDINEKGLLLKDGLAVNHRENIEKYMSETAAFITAGSNFTDMIKQNAPDVYKNSIVLPQLKGSNSEYDISIMNFIIPKRAKNKELAKEFAHLLLNYENQMALAKKTNVLPVNKEALNNDYFKNCGTDLIDSARCIASKQLNSPLNDDFGFKNKKEINDLINNSLETILIKGKEKFDPVSLYNSLNGLIKD